MWKQIIKGLWGADRQNHGLSLELKIRNTNSFLSTQVNDSKTKFSVSIA